MKTELSRLHNPSQADDDDNTMIEHRSSVGCVSNGSNVSDTSGRESQELLDDPEVVNFNKIQYLKALYFK